MKNLILGIGMVVLLCISACQQKTPRVSAQAAIHSTTDNSLIGKVEFVDLGDGQVKMQMDINYPKKADSSVAVHFHEHGNCGNMGEDAHGHWNPTGENHGKWGIDPYHSGDIGNIALDNSGNASYSLISNRWSLKEGESNFIGNLGIIIHGGIDDYSTQPTGNSGPRVGCGIIQIRN